MDKPNTDGLAFVSPYLNRRLRSVDEVLKAKERRAAWKQQVEAERQKAGWARKEARLRLVYSRPDGDAGATAG